MMARAVLTEIYMALRELEQHGRSHTIYISKYNLSEKDRVFLNDILADGIVTVEDTSPLQRAQWIETALAGVWKGLIFDTRGTPAVETIEICRFPSLAQSQEDEISQSVKQLQELLHIYP